MNGNDKRIKTRHRPEETLGSYLELLLSEVEEYRDPSLDATCEIKPEPEDAYLPNSLSQLELHRPTIERDQPEIETPLDVQPAQEPAKSLATLNRRGVEIPAWGRTTFQCLLFKVKNLTLAAPLLALDSIARWQDDITAIPGQPDWHLGVVLYRDRHVVAVDTANLIMPERLDSAHAPGGSHLLIIGDYRWGLTCDALQRPVTLEPGNVRWRRHDNMEPWKAGIVTEKLCVLLNIERLMEIIR